MQNAMNSVAQLVQDVIDGNESPLRAYGELRMLEKSIKQALEEIHADVELESSKHPDKTFQDGIYEFTKMPGHATYSFKHIPQWAEQSERIKEIERLAKVRANNPNAAIVDGDGVEIDPAEVKFTRPGVSVKLIQ